MCKTEDERLTEELHNQAVEITKKMLEDKT